MEENIFEFDEWRYFEADDYVVVVNLFREGDETGAGHKQNILRPITVNTYVALKKDVEKEVSVHEVMKELEEVR